MKTIKLATTLFLTLGLISFSSAQTPTSGGGGGTVTQPVITSVLPASLPIGSKGMLRAYAVEQVCGGSLSLWGESIMWDSSSLTSTYFHPGTPPTVDEVIQELKLTEFHFKVADKSKPLNAWSMLHNSEGEALFYGYCPASVSAQGIIQCDELVMKLNGNVPIYVGQGVRSAQIRSENNWVDLYPSNGYIFFPVDYTEKDGMFILNDGNRDTGYSLRTGSQVPLMNVSGTIGTTIDGYYSFTADDQTSVVYVNLGNCQTGNGHEAPVASINITSATPKTVKFLCKIWNNGKLVEQPAFGWIFKKGSDTEMPVSLNPGEWSGTMTLEKGEWFFYPETSLFETSVPVNYYGEKGN